MLETKEYTDRSKKKLHHRSSACVFLTRLNDHGETECLLQRRCNTGLYDGWWDAGIAGGVEVGESPVDTAIQEGLSEMGVTLAKENLKFIGVAWIISELGEPISIYYFKADEWGGEPTIKEPDKCDAIGWFDINKIPEKMARDRRFMTYWLQGGNTTVFVEYDERTNEIKICGI